MTYSERNRPRHGGNEAENEPQDSDHPNCDGHEHPGIIIARESQAGETGRVGSKDEDGQV